MPLPAFLVPMLLAAAGAAGGALSRGKQKQTQTTDNTSTTTPTMDPAYAPMQQLLMRRFMGRAGQRSALPSGYVNNRVSDINRTYSNLGEAQQGRLAAAGLGGSPVAETGAFNLDMARGGDINQMLGEVPLIEDQMDQNNLAQASNFLNTGRGSTTTTKGTGVSTSGGGTANMIGGGLEGMADILGFLWGKGNFAGGKTASTPQVPGFARFIASKFGF